jgi:hypothetical protein
VIVPISKIINANETCNFRIINALESPEKGLEIIRENTLAKTLFLWRASLFYDVNLYGNNITIDNVG